MKSIFNLLSIAFLVILISACEKMETRKPIDNDSVKPGVVSNVTVTNQNGSAIITYNVPGDADLQYIKAIYITNKNGTVRESRASQYDSKVIVDGFQQSADYTVKLIAVDKSENEGDAISITVHPLTPAYILARQSLIAGTTFGGLSVKFKNALKAKLAIIILTENVNKEFVPTSNYYTVADSGSFAARGFDVTPRKFGVFVRDQFDNYSDTLYTTVNPLLEKELDKTKFREYALPTDIPTGFGWVMSNMWNNTVAGNGYHTLQGAGIMPLHFTFDLGATYKLSRFKIFQRIGTSYTFQWGNPRKWTMWGANTPDPAGSYNGWTKLMDCESIKPSGSGAGVNTADDIAYATNGEEFTFPDGLPAVRYIRVQMTQSWSNGDFFHLMEMTFWGNN